MSGIHDTQFFRSGIPDLIFVTGIMTQNIFVLLVSMIQYLCGNYDTQYLFQDHVIDFMCCRSHPIKFILI